MSTLDYVTVDQVRARAHNINTLIYSDEEIGQIISRHAADLHLKLGRAKDDAFAETDPQYESAQIYVLNSAACELLSSIEGVENDVLVCERMAKRALESLSEKSDIGIITAHHDLIDGLDPDHYSQQF